MLSIKVICISNDCFIRVCVTALLEYILKIVINQRLGFNDCISNAMHSTHSDAYSENHITLSFLLTTII